MNCLEFRRQLSVDPHCRDADFVQHRTECPRCAEAHARALSFESMLEAAIAVPVPEHLAERILLAQATAQRMQDRTQRRRWTQYAVAASLVVIVGAAGMMAYARLRQPSGSQLADLAVAHLAGEPLALTSHEAVPDALVQREFALRADIAMPAVPSGVTYLSDCPLGPYHIVHMAMAQAGDPAVTVMYVPQHREAQRQDFDRAGWHTREVPLGTGTLVLLGKSTVPFDQIEGQWQSAVGGTRLGAL